MNYKRQEGMVGGRKERRKGERRKGERKRKKERKKFFIPLF